MIDIPSRCEGGVGAPRHRLVLIGSNLELRIVSIIVRARESVDEVVLLDRGSSDATVELAERLECPVLTHVEEHITASSLASLLEEAGLQDAERTLFLRVNDAWRLRDLPLSINRLHERWDVHVSIVLDEDEGPPEDVVLLDADVQHLQVTPAGFAALAALGPLGTAMDLPEDLGVRVSRHIARPNVHQAESLASASRMAQMFYWMLESKHPLVLIGLPGLVLFVLGIRLSGNVIDQFKELNSTSLGVTLATVAVTLMGLFALMTAVLLWIMEKQVASLHHQVESEGGAA